MGSTLGAGAAQPAAAAPSYATDSRRRCFSLALLCALSARVLLSNALLLPTPTLNSPGLIYRHTFIIDSIALRPHLHGHRLHLHHNFNRPHLNPVFHSQKRLTRRHHLLPTATIANFHSPALLVD